MEGSAISPWHCSTYPEPSFSRSANHIRAGLWVRPLSRELN
jgi:hypothetical protein